jgi:hypothetical protein
MGRWVAFEGCRGEKKGGVEGFDEYFYTTEVGGDGFQSPVVKALK